jgi:hypothetical protein
MPQKTKQQQILELEQKAALYRRILTKLRIMASVEILAGVQQPLLEAITRQLEANLSAVDMALSLRK